MQIAALIALVILSGLESYRITTKISQKYVEFDKAQAVALFLSMWAVVVTLIFMIPAFVQNYHGQHSDSSGNAHHSSQESK